MVGPGEARAPGRLASALGDFAVYMPALLAGMLCLRVAELGSRLPADGGAALANDVLAIFRYGPLVLLLSLPFLLARAARTRLLAVGAAWSVLLCLHGALAAYYGKAGVPLGADLFAYSGSEIATTVMAAAPAGSALPWAMLAGVVALWTVLLLRSRRPTRPGAREVLLWTGVCLVLGALFPASYDPSEGKNASRAAAVLNKSAFFVSDSVAWVSGSAAPSAPVVADSSVDPRYPFLRDERTPDTLGQHFRADGKRAPNIVIVVVEGLGRSFSGPGARLGSFTPFLDELAGRSLYFENFLAAQGRTFAVLPSILGSLPFGAQGFAALDGAMPAHASLPGVLKAQGYRLRYYSGSNLDFDKQGAFLRNAGFTDLVSQADFSPAYQISSDWGYADRDLVETVIARERQGGAEPSLTLIQTSTMHTPFLFPDKEAWEKKADERIAALGIAEDKREAYRPYRDIYASILYADAALRLYFDEMVRLPAHANTIYIVTGDHRLPELAMDTRLERYHVPLLVYSPLLKAPQRIKSVSSHLDLAPSLLAFLSNSHGLRTPAQVTWLGSGLDLEPGFRNLHTIPIKQTKTEMSDFISGTALLAQDKLFTITDGMQLEPSSDAATHQRVREQFARFLAANGGVRAGSVLAPAGTEGRLAAYKADKRAIQVARLAAEAAAVQVSAVSVRAGAGRTAAASATFANGARGASPVFVPLLVVSDAKGREVGEGYGKPLSLEPGRSAAVELAFSTPLPAGQYYLSVLPSHPETGKPAGSGQYRIPLLIQDAK